MTTVLITAPAIRGRGVRIRRRTAKGTRAAAVLTALAALGFVAASPVQAAAKRPACDEIAGYTRAQNDEWRLVAVRLRSAGNTWRLLACRRSRAGAARVRVLGPATPGVDEFSIVNRVAELQGDRVILLKGSGSSGGGRFAQTVVDLAVGRARTLGVSRYSSDGSELFDALLTPTGALATIQGKAPGGRPLTPLRLWDVAGVGPTGPNITAMAASLGTGPADSGIYVVDTAGVLSRRPVAGPFPAALLSARKDLRWQSPKLAAKKTVRGERRTELRASEASGDGAIELVESTRSAEAGAASIQLVHPDSHKRQSVALAPGSAGELKVLGGTYFSVLVAGRFADDPARRRVRLLTFAGYTSVPVDIDATPAIEQAGQVVVSSGNSVAISDGATIRTWRTRSGAPVPASYPVVGARDLVWVGAELWFTDAAGAAQRLTVDE